MTRVTGRAWLELLRTSLAALGAATLLVAAPASANGLSSPIDADEDNLPIALLVDGSTGQVLYSRNPDRRFVPASITKVMTLYTAFEWIEDNNLNPDRPLIVEREVWEEWQGKGSRMFLNAGDQVPLAELLTGIANISANDASAVLAHSAAGSVPQWAQWMNANAQRLGMKQSHFGTPNGWPDEGRTFTTARDLVTLGRALVEDHPEKVSRYIGKPGFSYAGIAQVNHDPILGRVAGADGIKTGYTNEAGFGFLGTAKRGDQRLFMVVAGAPRKRFRDTAARRLMEWGFSHFERRPLFEEGAVIGTARVQGGAMREIGLGVDAPVIVSVPRGTGDAVTMTIVYEGPIRAPIAAGEVIASLEISIPDMQTIRVPLKARQAVEKAGFFGRIANAFAGWFS